MRALGGGGEGVSLETPLKQRYREPLSRCNIAGALPVAAVELR